ncbi:MAG: SufD family Fe-S cluster assembly protein [Flavobacteriaceae bacterium]
MDLKEKLVSSFLAFENEVDVDAFVHDIRSEAIKTFEEKGFPTKKEEAWKYTSLNKVLKHNYSVFPQQDTTLEYRDIKKYFIHDIDSYKIVFVDGRYSSHLSQTTHEGMDICLLSAAISKPKYRLVIENYFNKAATKDSLSALNTAFSSEGAYIHIPKNKLVEKPIQIIHFSTGNESALMLQPRNLIITEENSHVQIIERHQSLTENPVLTNSVTEIFANKRAIIDYYKVQNDNNNASLIDNTFVKQQQGSHCYVHTFAFGGKLIRNNLNFFQNGERIDSTLKGVTIIGEGQHVDHNTLVHHQKPNCESHQDYKGIFGDNTIGQIDENALFYLRTRGIPIKEAKALLMYAFSNNVLSSVKIPELKQRITKLIANKLGVNIGFNL